MEFEINLNIRTEEGFRNFGKFQLGKNREQANAIFNLLKGSYEAHEKHVLQLDLVELRNGLPYNLRMLSCSLEELSSNCKIITRELFKCINLEKSI